MADSQLARVGTQGTREADGAEDCPQCHGVGWLKEADGSVTMCDCRRKEVARRRAVMLRQRSGITDERLRMWRFETFDPKRAQPLPGKDPGACRHLVGNVKRACEAYAADPKGWLVLVGGVGCGKTHLAYAIAAAALVRGLAV
ncbi:MAG: hypothetical protein ABFD96_20460 [Armatimonadia bacterium]